MKAGKTSHDDNVRGVGEDADKLAKKQEKGKASDDVCVRVQGLAASEASLVCALMLLH